MTVILASAIAVHHTATVDTAWDGPAAVAAMPTEYADLHYCHAWQSADADASSHTAGDDDADDKKSAYKFPHHKTKGGPANLNACRNGLARLDSADLPEGDKAGVKKHLQAHLDDADGDKKDRFGNVLTIMSQRQPRPTAQLREGRTDWYRIDNHADLGTADVWIYDEIGYWGITAGDFVNAINAVTASQINLHINSPGGEVFDGVAIFTAIENHPATVTSYIDGIAASAASFIAMAGDKVVMARSAMMMIHDASGMCIGDANTMRTTAGLLDQVSDTIAAIYAEKSGGDAADWRAVMQETRWYTADAALAAGLLDEITAAPDKTTPGAGNTWDLSIFKPAASAADPAPIAVVEPVIPAAVVPVEAVPEPEPDPAPPTDSVPPFVWDADQVRAALQSLRPSEEAVV
jgi:ATP-dependent protease ClpP protease subunit